MKDEWVYDRGRMTKLEDLSLWRRILRITLAPLRLAGRRLRRRRLERWTKEVEP